MAIENFIIFKIIFCLYTPIRIYSIYQQLKLEYFRRDRISSEMMFYKGNFVLYFKVLWSRNSTNTNHMYMPDFDLLYTLIEISIEFLGIYKMYLLQFKKDFLVHKLINERQNFWSLTRKIKIQISQTVFTETNWLDQFR